MASNPRTRFSIRCLLLMLGLAAPVRQTPALQVLLEAEQFAATGGWDVDQQCMDQMPGDEFIATYTHGEGYMPAIPCRTIVRSCFREITLKSPIPACAGALISVFPPGKIVILAENKTAC